MRDDIPKRSIQDALHWAFQVQKARLSFGDENPDGRHVNVSLEWIMMQKAALGVTIDGGPGPSKVHIDAENIAAAVSTLPPELGGRKFAVRLVQFAAAQDWPEPVGDVVFHLQPEEWKRPNQHSEPMGATRVVQVYREEYEIPHPRNSALKLKRKRKFKGEWVPCHFVPDPAHIAWQEAEYEMCRKALIYLRDTLAAKHTFSRFVLLPDVPPRQRRPKFPTQPTQ